MSKKQKLLLLAFTVIEVATLVGWLALVPVNQILAILVLLVGFTAEYIVNALAAGRNIYLGNTAFAAGVESAIWILWLLIVGAAGPLVGLLFLFGTFLFAHTWEENGFVTNEVTITLPRQGAVLPSILEAVISTVWITAGGVGGVVVLAIGLYAEHIIGLKNLLARLKASRA